MDQLHMLRAFVAAAQHRSFSKAAVSLGVTTGSISKAIARLESTIQTRLLYRTTRTVALTEAAEPYFLSCCRLLQELDEANRRIARERATERGRLRLVVHPTLISGTFARLVAQFHGLAPNVSLAVSVDDGVVRLYDGKFDIAIVPPHLVEQSAVIRRRLSASSRVWVASPGYLDRHGAPRSAAELAEHFLLLDRKARAAGDDRVEVIEGERLVSAMPKSFMEGNDVMLRTAAIAGTGIASLPELMIREDLANGALIPILPNCSVPDADVEICLFYSHRELLPARFRTFIDFCVEFFRGEQALRASPPVRRTPSLALV